MFHVKGVWWVWTSRKWESFSRSRRVCHVSHVSDELSQLRWHIGKVLSKSSCTFPLNVVIQIELHPAKIACVTPTQSTRTVRCRETTFLENLVCFLLPPLSLSLASRSIVGNNSFTHQLLVWSVSEELKLRFVSDVSKNVILAWSCLITTEFLSKLRVNFTILNNSFSFSVSRTLPLQWHSKIWGDVLRMKEKRWHQNVFIEFGRLRTLLTRV